MSRNLAARHFPRLVNPGIDPGNRGVDPGIDPAGRRTSPVRPIGPPRPRLVVAGCDPALPLLTEPLSLLDPPIGFSWWPCSSQEALRLAAEGLVHAAGAHLRDCSGEYNTGTAAEARCAGGGVIGFSAARRDLPAQRGPAGYAVNEHVRARPPASNKIAA